MFNIYLTTLNLDDKLLLELASYNVNSNFFSFPKVYANIILNYLNPSETTIIIDANEKRLLLESNLLKEPDKFNYQFPITYTLKNKKYKNIVFYNVDQVKALNQPKFDEIIENKEKNKQTIINLQ